MSWTETHRYYAALREVETELDLRRDGELPWRPEYATVFGSPGRLLDALRTRWMRLVQAQADEWGGVEALAAAHPGLYAAVTGRFAPPVAVIAAPESGTAAARGARLQFVGAA